MTKLTPETIRELRERVAALLAEVDNAVRLGDGFDTGRLRLAAEAVEDALSVVPSPLQSWYESVRVDWEKFWQGQDHRYGRDYAAFVGERLRTDFRLKGPNTAGYGLDSGPAAP